MNLRTAHQPRVGLITFGIIVLSLGYGAMHALLQSPARSEQPEPQTAATSTVAPREECLRLAAKRPDYFTLGEERYRRVARAWGDSCRQAIAAGDTDSRLKVALAHSIDASERPEQIAVLREATAQDNAEANFMIYDSHRSWDRRSDRPQLVSRAEAERTLRRAAELGYPDAVFRLARLLDSGDTVKRDRAEAARWVERMLADPPKDMNCGSLQVFLGELLAKSSNADERSRGLDLLEKLSAAGRSDATAELGVALRNSDPARARALLEKALFDSPGRAAPTLSDMLRKGEGGPANPKRGLKIVTGHNDIGAIEGARGQFYLEGQDVKRDVRLAVKLIEHAGVWDLDSRQQVLRILARNPTVYVDHMDRTLYEAMEAAELDEPGAMQALIDLKLSPHEQFRDKVGGCKLAATAMARGQHASPQHLEDCRNAN